MTRTLSFLLLLPLAALLSACAHLPGTDRQQQPEAELSGLGKVHLYYVPSETDPEGLSFHVYRGEALSGPFQRVTAEPAALPEDADHGSPALVWTDYGLPLGKDFYYYLQELRPDGTARKATAVGRSRVDIPLQQADAGHLAGRRERGI